MTTRPQNDPLKHIMDELLFGDAALDASGIKDAFGIKPDEVSTLKTSVLQSIDRAEKETRLAWKKPALAKAHELRPLPVSRQAEAPEDIRKRFIEISEKEEFKMAARNLNEITDHDKKAMLDVWDSLGKGKPDGETV